MNGKIIKNKSKYIVLALMIIILVQLIVKIGIGSQKEYMHMDEGYSYGLMNYTSLSIDTNEDFFNTWHDKKYYEDYLSISKEESTDLSPVYTNQKNDVHPPLYYLLLRLFASFTLDDFSMWTGICLNLLISVFCSIFVFLISKYFSNNKLALLITLFSGLALSALESVVYIRMYELTALFVLITMYIHLRNYNKEKISLTSLILLGVVAILGSLTHYYYVIFLSLIFIIFILNYIRKKEIQNIIKYIITLITSASISLAIFPYSINHVFLGYRGAGAIKNSLDNIIDFITNFGAYVKMCGINTFLFIPFLAIVILVIAVNIKQKNKNEKGIDCINKTGLKAKLINLLKNDFNLIVIPCIIYLVIIAFISPYQDLRYILPITYLVSIATIITCYNLIVKLTTPKKAYIYILCSLIVITFITIFVVKINCTYAKFNNIAKKMETEYNLPTIYSFNTNNSRFLDDIYLFTKIDKSVILKYNDDLIYDNISNMLKKIDTSNGIILICNEGYEHKEFIDKLIGFNGFTNYIQLQKLNAATIYYIK